jgi:hypothetical protein
VRQFNFLPKPWKVYEIAISQKISRNIITNRAAYAIEEYYEQDFVSKTGVHGATVVCISTQGKRGHS